MLQKNVINNSKRKSNGIILNIVRHGRKQLDLHLAIRTALNERIANTKKIASLLLRCKIIITLYWQHFYYTESLYCDFEVWCLPEIKS